MDDTTGLVVSLIFVALVMIGVAVVVRIRQPKVLSVPSTASRRVDDTTVDRTNLASKPAPQAPMRSPGSKEISVLKNGAPVLQTGMQIGEVIKLLGHEYTRASLADVLGNARGLIGRPPPHLERGMVAYIWDHPAGRYQVLCVDGVVTQVNEQPV